MYRPNEYNAAIYEGRYPGEDGAIPEIYQQVVQSEAEDAIQRIANMGIKEHGILLDDIAENIRNNAKKTRIDLVTRENSSPIFDDIKTVAATTPNAYNYSSKWIFSDADAYPSTVHIPLFDARQRYSNILPPIREMRVPYVNVKDRGVMGIDNSWRLNDPYFGRRIWDFDLGRLTSDYWDDIQHEFQHAVGQDMIDLSATHHPKYNGVFDTEDNLLYKVENQDYPMGLIERNFDMGKENWGKDIGGKVAEVDADLHAKIAGEQFINPEQNISNWNSLYDY